ncbi:MAG: hypothetical protein RSB05_06630 [Clostridiales bacterium]
MDEYGRKALLFDVYGPLLTKRQQEIYDLVHGEDMSLGEIAENLAISCTRYDKKNGQYSFGIRIQIEISGKIHGDISKGKYCS